MKKVLLITPPEQHIMMEAGDRPHLGTLYLLSALKRVGHKAYLSDLNHDSYKTLKEKIKKIKPDYIGITTLTPYFNWVKNFSAHLKQNYSNIKLIAGGPHATILPDTLNNFDYIIMGEGEEAIIDVINNDYPVKAVTRYDLNPEKNLDNLAMPDRSILKKNYGMKFYGTKGTTMTTTRSCNYNCFYCTKNILGSHQREHSINYVIKEIKNAVKNGFNGIYFQDDCFTSDRERCINLAKAIIKNKIKIKYMIITRADMVDEEMLKIMKRSGLVSVSFGFEHASDVVLKRINKGFKVKDIIKSIKICKKLKLKIKGNFILNLPGATGRTMYKCLKLAKKYNLDSVAFYSLTAYPGTPLWDNPNKYGCKIVSRDYNMEQSLNSSNVELLSMSNKKFKEIIKNIKKGWAKFKQNKVPWER